MRFHPHSDFQSRILIGGAEVSPGRSRYLFSLTCMETIMRRRFPLWILGAGLLPLWASIAVMLVGSIGRSNSEYWAAAPWLVIAATPFCAVSMAIAVITHAVYRATEGGQNRKLARAAAASAFMLAIVAAGAGILW